MNDGLKQRIVGALVLIALGVIFVPVIFDKGRIDPVDRNSQIPTEPTIRTVALPQPPLPPRPRDPRLLEPSSGDFTIEDDDIVLGTEENFIPDVVKEAALNTDVKAIETDPIVEDLDDDKRKGFSDSTGYVASLKLDAAKDKIATAEDRSARSSNIGVERDEKSGLAKAWVLQVASHESDAAAEALKVALGTLGYKAFKRDVDTKVGKRTRVFVGPNISKPVLERAKQDIDKRYKVSSILLRYKP